MQSVKILIIQEVSKTPTGHVTNYGHIAKLVTLARGSVITAQVVGWQLSGLTQQEWSLCPWQRVVAKNGHISALKLGEKGWIQKEMLATEGVVVGPDDTVDMAQYGWYGE